MAAKTVKILPTSFSVAAAAACLSDEQRGMVSNAIDRSICIGLSDRFEIVVDPSPADLTAGAVTTHGVPTGDTAAGGSRVISVGASVPPIPIGPGGLAVDAEARDQNGHQEAAMIWGRGVALTSNPKVSTASDAYDLAKSFAFDFSGLPLEWTDKGAPASPASDR